MILWFVCGGATKGRGIQVEGKDLKGVHFAVDFLKANTKSLLDSEHKDGAYVKRKGQACHRNRRRRHRN